MSYLSWSSDFFETACGPKPRSQNTLRALSSNQGDTFFAEVENRQGEGESYQAWLQRRDEWFMNNKQVYFLNADVQSHLMSPVTSYIETFLGVPCSPLVVRTVANGMRFVQEKSVPGSCGEGGCENQVKAIAAHDILTMVERTSEAMSGAIVVVLTSSAIFTEWEGITDVARSDKGRIAVVSIAHFSDTTRNVCRLALRAVSSLIGFVPCMWMKCVLNSLNTCASEHLVDVACPACLRRIACLHGNSEFDYSQRYYNLHQWYQKGESLEQNSNVVEWLRERYFAINGRHMPHVEDQSEATKEEEQEQERDPSKEEIRSKLRLLKIKRNRKKGI